MRLFFALFSVLTIVFFTSAAMAQSADIQWKDLSAGERQGILNQWRALPQAEKGPFITYREQAIKNLSEEKKAQYSDVAKERAEKEKALQAAYEKRQAAEEKTRAAEEKAEPATIDTPAPIITETKKIEPIKPAEAVPMSNAEPAINAEGVIPDRPVPAAEKAKDMLKKFF